MNTSTRGAPSETRGIDEDDNVVEQEQEETDSNGDIDRRHGTLTSARFNILSTMVGGGSLSLPLAFFQAGNSFLAPLLLIAVAALVKASVHLLINSALMSQTQHAMDIQNKKGTASFEATACAAFGPRAKYLAMSLIATICYLTLVGYAVLLRDMLLPLSDYLFHADENSESGPTFHHNITMLTVVLLITPLCTMRDLTPLEKVGALSMLSISVVACCISYRSFQCNFSSEYDDIRLTEWYNYIHLLPAPSTASTSSFHHLLDAMPVLISVFMCHFNVLPVHNELQNPTPERVNKLFASSIWGASIFYIAVGFTGSMFGNCTEKGQVEGNVLLSFDEDDVLLMVGRSCLSLTISFAFPVLVVPCRDILLRAWDENRNTEQIGSESRLENGNEVIQHDNDLGINSNLAEPLLPRDGESGSSDHEINSHEISASRKAQFGLNARRRAVSIAIFWSGAGVACFVKSIEIVWDVLGGSLSLIMGFLIPSAAYSILWHRRMNSNQDEAAIENDEEESTSASAEESPCQDTDNSFVIEEKRTALIQAYTLIAIFGPMVFILTGNAIYNIHNQ